MPQSRTCRIAGDEVLAHIKSNSILKLKNDNVVVYPNPASNYIEVSYDEKQNATFKLYNAQGETTLIKRLYHSNLKQQIDLNTVSTGLYHYEIQFEDKTKAVGKITIVN